MMSSFQLYIAVFLLDKGIDPALYCGFYFTYMDILVSPLKKKNKQKTKKTKHEEYPRTVLISKIKHHDNEQQKVYTLKQS